MKSIEQSKLKDHYINNGYKLEPYTQDDIKTITDILYKHDYEGKRLDHEFSVLSNKFNELTCLSNDILDQLDRKGYINNDVNPEYTLDKLILILNIIHDHMPAKGFISSDLEDKMESFELYCVEIENLPYYTHLASDEYTDVYERYKDYIKTKYNYTID